MFHDLNQKYFFGLLVEPEFIKFSNNTPPNNGAYAFGNDAIMGAYADNKIWLHRKLSRRKLRATIAHEMIHQFQDIAGYDRDECHGIG